MPRALDHGIDCGIVRHCQRRNGMKKKNQTATCTTVRFSCYYIFQHIVFFFYIEIVKALGDRT